MNTYMIKKEFQAGNNWPVIQITVFICNTNRNLYIYIYAICVCIYICIHIHPIYVYIGTQVALGNFR